MTRDREPLFPPDLDWIPRPPVLERHPELALLAVLHVALATLVPALVAAHPHLAIPDPPSDRETLAAHRLLVSVWHFQRENARYARDLAAAIHSAPVDHHDLDDDF